MREAIYPGSFDPITLGHMDIIKRAMKVFDKLTVAVLINVDKKGMFTIEERVQMIKHAISDFENVEVISFSGLLVNLVKEKKEPIIIKGLRNSTDFNYEMQMDILNKMLDKKCETMYFIADSKYNVVSSSAVKQIIAFNGNIEGMVPSIVSERVKEMLNLV
ncbi:MAG: pantetheine-phosphate adenylyltransferase [Sarcina sp.]